MFILLSTSIHIHLNITNSQNVFNELKHPSILHGILHIFTDPGIILVPLFTLADALIDVCTYFGYKTFYQVYI